MARWEIKRPLPCDADVVRRVVELDHATGREHFPRLHDWRIDQADGRHRLVNRTAGGEDEAFDDLVFHGGEGMTLEMRHFAEGDLMRRLAAAGFSTARVHGEHYPPYGILWPIDHSLPIVARA